MNFDPKFSRKYRFLEREKGDLSDNKWRWMDDNYTAVLLMKMRLKI